jgi:hypothetical protein
MVDKLNRSGNRLSIDGMNVRIGNEGKNRGTALERVHIFQLVEAVPTVSVLEDGKVIRAFRLETTDANPDLTGQFLHSSIRIFANSGVMIDGVISKSACTCPTWQEPGYEGVRLQPFLLSDKVEENVKLAGLGLFRRGLHFSGAVTPTSVRAVCFCDRCRKSFTLQHFHAGFSEVQYFYSGDGKETLIVAYGAPPNLPQQLQKTIDPTVLATVEAALPNPTIGQGAFRYYNSFLCPHCQEPFIDFVKHNDIRPGEYYGNTLINVRPTRWPGA